MSDQSLRLVAPEITAFAAHLPLGRHLVESGAISTEQLVLALGMQAELQVPIGEILIAEGWADRDAVMNALSLQHDCPLVDLVHEPPDPALIGLRGHEFWLKHRAIPWKRLGNAVLVATTRPDLLDQVALGLEDDVADILPVLAPEAAITAAIAGHFTFLLAHAAETRVAPEFSCRDFQPYKPAHLLVLALLLGGAIFVAPYWMLSLLSLVAVLSVLLFFTLKLTGFLAHILSHGHLTAPRGGPSAAARHELQMPQTNLPKVSVLVPLYKETEIVGALVRRLQKLSYPKVLLDVVLVLEEHDGMTRQTLQNTDLPPWIRVIEVPAHNGLTTKPRAMNYALDFCNGDIIGIWDAEDAPAPDQIEQVVARFGEVPDDVVCLQGILDYYNPRTNWLSRCFTIEYSSWFRIVLPGIARLGLVVPLGGTTLFFRREPLEELGGWDAHNVTEDADLGVRLCRAGWRTEMIDTATFEEANCRVWPWIRQRSRWLKGFMVTYLVHMRSPRRLLRDLGPWRFIGFQAFFIGTLGQFLMAPVLLSFWLVVFGFAHPVSAVLPGTLIVGGVSALLLSETLGLCIGMAAVSRPGRRHLLLFVPTMMFYFPLGMIAAYKALGELLLKPFFWDKTEHGHADEETP